MTLTLKGRGGYVVGLKGQGACTCHEEEEGNEQEHLESSFPGYVFMVQTLVQVIRCFDNNYGSPNVLE